MKKKLPLHSTTLLLLFLVVFSCTKDDPIATKGNIYGKVTEEVTGQFISGAQVTVSGVQETTITSQNGSYQFSELPAGSYSVNVSKSGYVSDSKTLTVVPEKTTSGDFVLEKDLPTLSSNALIFNNETKTATLTLKNTRSGVMNFSVESSKPWLKPNPLSSAIQPLNEKIITVSVDFTNVPYGNYQEYIVINVGEASIPIPVQIDYIQPPYIEITKPTADQTYKMGEVMPVEWSSNLTGKVKIELYRFSSPFLTIATETLNNQGGNYTWTLPAIQQESYQIRISSVENEQIAEITGAFNILEGPTVPSVLTKNPIQNLSTSVQIPGEILNIGIQATEISQYGHVYSKNNPNPSIADQKTRLGSSAQEKTYVSEITNLEPGQTYYIAAYATNAKGTAYGDVLTITTNADVPVVETATILSIAENTAISGGTVAADGGSDILERGLCWGVNAPVTVDSNTLIDGSNTTGTFTTNLTGLSPATTYYIRAYAKNASGVGYGQQKSFTTNAGLPSIKTILAQAKGATDAVAEGEVLSNGGENLTSFGFVYALTTNPTIENNKIEVGENVQGEYSYNLGNLIPQKTYYLRAYATNSIGTVYGAEKTFNTNEGAYFIINKPQESEKINVDQNYQIEWQSNLSSKRLIIEHFKGENLVRELSDNTNSNANNYKWYLPKNLEAADNNYIRILDYATLEEIGRSQVFEIGKHLAFLEPTNAQQVQPTAVTIKWESNYSTSLKFELYRGSSMITQIANGIEATAQQYTWNAAENFLPTATNYRIKMTDTQNNQFLFSDQFELLPAPPGVNTISNSQITHQSVFCEGSVYNDTGASIVDRGFVWAVTENPTLENAGNNKISLSSGAQNFQTTIYNLNRNTTYYLRAYATSSAGTGYGSQLVFKTLAQGVLLNTAAIRSITHDSAQCGGTISDDGGAEIIARGVCWSINPDPTTTDLKTSDGKGLGSFSSQLTGLNLNTTYYVRAYAINEIETFYGQQQSFTSRDGMVDMSTNPVTSITINSALSGGTINDNGGSSITARGICWSTNSNPTIADSKTSNGTGTGTFTSQLTGLALSTTYYTRAYAINGLGTSYGAQQSFTTGNGSVSINTAEISDIQTTSAVSGGHVLEDGGATITARGVCWSTNPNPTIADDKTEEGSGLGSFTSQITDLTLDTTYYVRSYAINDVETTYGQEVSFKTLEAYLNIMIPFNEIASGEQLEINWETNLKNESINIFINSLNGQTQRIAFDINTSALFVNWDIPENFIPGSYKIVIKDNRSNEQITESSYFNIQEGCKEVPIQDLEFENWLFLAGYDDIVDNKLNTCKIKDIEELIYPTTSTRVDWSVFKNLKTIKFKNLHSVNYDFDFTSNNIEKLDVNLYNYYGDFSWNKQTLKEAVIEYNNKTFYLDEHPSLEKYESNSRGLNFREIKQTKIKHIKAPSFYQFESAYNNLNYFPNLEFLEMTNDLPFTFHIVDELNNLSFLKINRGYVNYSNNRKYDHKIKVNEYQINNLSLNWSTYRFDLITNYPYPDLSNYRCLLKLDGNTKSENQSFSDGINYGASPCKNRFGETNKAMYFDGNDRTEIEITYPISNLLDTPIMIWFKIDDINTNADMNIIDFGSIRVYIERNSSTLKAYYESSGTAEFSIDLNEEWHFLVLTGDKPGSSHYSIDIDGKYVSGINTPSKNSKEIKSRSNCIIGEGFIGKIDHFAISNNDHISRFETELIFDGLIELEE